MSEPTLKEIMTPIDFNEADDWREYARIWVTSKKREDSQELDSPKTRISVNPIPMEPMDLGFMLAEMVKCLTDSQKHLVVNSQAEDYGLVVWRTLNESLLVLAPESRKEVMLEN